MPRMLTNAAVIMALAVGMPALAADEQPKLKTGTEADAQSAEGAMPEGDATMEGEQSAEGAMPEGEAATEDAQSAEGAMPEGEAATEDTQSAEGAMPEGEATTESEQSAEGGMTQGEGGMEAEGQAGTAESDMVGSGGASEEVDWTQHIGKTLMSPDGAELGEVSEVVAGPDGEPLVIIARGGFLGLGEKQYALMPSDLRVEDDQVVASMTEDQVAEMPEYEEPEPTE